MASVKLTAVLLATLALSGVLATGVRAAEPVTAEQAKALADRNQWAPLTQHRSFEIDAGKSPFGLKFDVDQQPGVSSEWKNVQVGGFFKITPTLRVGAGVSLTDQPNNAANPLAQQPAPPKVHLETTLKF